MTLWTAVVPIKPQGERKTRLRSRLCEQARTDLTDFMLQRVLDILGRSASIGQVAVLASNPLPGWSGLTFLDQGRGLNAELGSAAQKIPRRLVVLHADLPALTPETVDALTAAADRGVAIAPDRWLRGTNALAARDPLALAFAFGTGSFARHRALMPGSEILRHAGLAFDVDEPGDLDDALRSGRLPRAWA